MKKIIIILLISITKFGFAQSDEVYNQQGVSISYSITYINQTGQEKYKNILKNYSLKIIVRNSSGKTVNLGTGPSFSIDDYFYKERDYIYDEFRYELKKRSASVSLDLRDWTLKPSSTGYASVNFSIPDGYSIPIPSWSFLGFKFEEEHNPANPVEPESPKESAAPNTPKQYSDWKKINSPECDLGIEYTTKRVERLQLNYQLWFYYKVRNTSNKNISFVFNLTRNGKIEFSQSHVLSPGGEDEFMHKMSGNYIDGVSVTKVINTKTKKDVCNDSESDQNASATIPNTGATNQTSTPNQTGNAINLSDKISELERLCSEIGSINSASAVAAAKANCISGATFENTKRDEQILQNRIDNLKNAIEPAKADEARIQKEAQEKQEKFNQYIQDGDSAMGSKNYDSAMGHYSNAKSYVSNSSESQLAERKYQEAYTAKRNAAREERLEKQKERDQKEDLAYTAAAAGMIGAMSLVNDSYTHKVSSGKLQFGLGYDQTPMITNQNNTYAPLASFADKASYPSLFIALRLEFLNNKPVNINVRGLYSLGIQAFDKGLSGSHAVTGFDGGIQFWYTTHTKFKLFADFGTYTRVGETVKDEDAANSGTTTTDEVREGEYDYKVFRYGGGPMFHHRHDGSEPWIKAGLFLENISFAKNQKKTMSFSLTANIESEIMVEVNYSKNYPVAGIINYPDAFTFKNQNFLSIKLIRQGNLW